MNSIEDLIKLLEEAKSSIKELETIISSIDLSSIKGRESFEQLSSHLINIKSLLSEIYSIGDLSDVSPDSKEFENLRNKLQDILLYTDRLYSKVGELFKDTNAGNKNDEVLKRRKELLEDIRKELDSLRDAGKNIDISLISSDDENLKRRVQEIKDSILSLYEQINNADVSSDSFMSWYEKLEKTVSNIKKEIESLNISKDSSDIIDESKVKDAEEALQGLISAGRDVSETDVEINLSDLEVDEKATKVEDRFKKLKKTIEDLKKEFPGLSEYLNRFGIDLDKLADGVKVKTLDIEKGLKKITFKEGFSVFYRGDINEFFSNIQDAKNALSADFLSRVKSNFSGVVSEARRLGFELKNLKRVEEISNGVMRFSFAVKESGGVTRRLVVYSDRLGNVLVDNQKRFLSLTDSIIRNTIEAARWAFAINVVYGGMKKLNEAIDEAIQNQERLASIAVVLGTGRNSFNQIFNSAIEVADELGVKVGEVLDGFTSAFRVAGSEAQNYADRFKVATSLLQDALVLSKLTGEDSAKSMDLLISSLRQVNLPLTDSTRLLDRWVYLSTKSSVTTLDLAAAFSSAAATAKTVGIGRLSPEDIIGLSPEQITEEYMKEMDVLSGYIAALSETTSYTGEEIGNILRSLFSNIQSEEAQRKLLDFGIATRTASGELRDFDEILSEIYSKYKSGIISESQLGEIGRIIGGGARRGPQFVQLVKSYELARRYTDTLHNSNIKLGYSYDAIDVKTQTAQSAINRMANAFQRLAATMGEEGALDAINRLASGMTFLLNSASSLLDITGESGLVGIIVLLSNSITKSTYAMRAFDRMIERVVRSMYRLKGASSEVIDLKVENALANSSKYIRMLQAASIAIGSFITAESNIAGAASAAGSLLGFYLGGPFGAFLGSSAGNIIGKFVDDFVNATEKELAPQVTQILSAAISEGIESGVKDGIEKSRTGQIEEKILDPGTKAASAFASYVLDVFGFIDKATFGAFSDTLLPEGLRNMVGSEEYQNADRYARALSIIIQQYKELGAEFVKSRYGLSDEDIKLLDEYINTLNIAVNADISKPFSNQQAMLDLINSGYEITAEHLGNVNRLQSQYREEVEKSFAAGEISYKEYRDSLEKISRFQAVLIPLVQDFGEQLSSVGGEARSLSDIYDDMALIFMEGTKEEINAILALDSAIKAVREKTGKIGTEEEQKLVQELDSTIKGILSNIARRRLKLPVYMNLQDMSTDDIEVWLDEIKRLQEEYIKEAVANGLVPDEKALRNYFNGIEPILVYTREGLLKAVGEGLDIQRFGQLAKKNLEEAGLLSTDTGKFDIRILDIPSSRRKELESALANAARTLQEFAPYYKMDMKDIGVIFSDNVTDILHVDMLQLQLALRELVELNRDQLDGIYNLPSSATFFVPWTAWELAAQSALNRSGTGGGVSGETGKSSVDEDLKGLLDQDVRNGAEMLEYLSQLNSSVESIKNSILTQAQIKLLSPGVTGEDFHGSVSNIDETMKNYVEYLEEKYKPFLQYPHGSVYNMDEQIRRYNEYRVGPRTEYTPERQVKPEENIDRFSRMFNNQVERLSEIIERFINSITSEDSNWFGNTTEDIIDAIRALDIKTDLNINLAQKIELKLDGKVVYAQLMNNLYRDMLSRSKTSTVSQINNII